MSQRPSLSTQSESGDPPEKVRRAPIFVSATLAFGLIPVLIGVAYLAMMKFQQDKDKQKETLG